MSDRREPLPALTALRFFAAAAVLLLHLVALHPEPLSWCDRFWWGTAGVTFFFTLSGFILTYNYLDRFQTLSRRAVRDFYAARFARIFPVHVLGFLAVVPLCTDGQLLLAGGFMRVRWKAVVNLSLSQAFVPTESWHVSYNSPSWSLSAEWFFYLSLPFLIWAWVRASRRGRIALGLACCTCWAAALALNALLEPSATLKWFCYFFPPTRLFDFAAGCLLGWVMVRWAPSAPAPIHGRWRATAWEVLAVAGVVAAIQVAPYRQAEDMFFFSWCGYFTLPFAALIWVFAQGRGHLAELLALRLPVYLGEVSYAVYMLHLPALLTAGVATSGMPFAVRAVVAVALALTASVVCYHLYEMPLRNWLRRKLSTPRGPAGGKPRSWLPRLPWVARTSNCP